MRFAVKKQGIRFEWDSQKALSNFHKHNVRFETACEAFFDPFVRLVDIEKQNKETRETIIGMDQKWKVLCVVYTLRKGGIFRIISARNVTKTERRFYEEL